MTPTRTAIVGSALPLLVLIGLVGFPPARAAMGLERMEAEPSKPAGLLGSATPAPRSAVPPSADEAVSITRLRRSIRAGRELGFTGTETVSAWHTTGSTTRVLDLAQIAGGARTVTARDTSGPGRAGSAPATDALAGLSERALDALAAGYDLRTDGTDVVAGRPAEVVVAARDGHEAARIWLDQQTGLLLRQDVLDSAGRLHRMAAFVSLQVTGTETPGAPGPGFGAGSRNVPVAVTPSGVPNSAGWSDVGPAELTALRMDGWPCPDRLPEGFVLLDVGRESAAAGGPALHLTYGDGLGAISVFLQRGQLDGGRLIGLTSQKWGDSEVFVRPGWPEVMVWQGGPTVITAVGDAEPSDLRAVLGALPRQSNHGTLGALHHRVGSALAWFTG